VAVAGVFEGESGLDSGVSLDAADPLLSDPDPEASEPVLEVVEESPTAALAGVFFSLLSFL
jgi:hypothetical protein